MVNDITHFKTLVVTEELATVLIPTVHAEDVTNVCKTVNQAQNSAYFLTSDSNSEICVFKWSCCPLSGKRFLFVLLFQ